MSDVTRFLDALSRGESQAADQLLEQVYQELRNLARARIGQEAAGHTLDGTGLVRKE